MIRVMAFGSWSIGLFNNPRLIEKEGRSRSEKRLQRFYQLHQGRLDKEREVSRLPPTVTLKDVFVQQECWRGRILTQNV